RLDARAPPGRLHQGEKFALVQVVGDVEVDEVAELVGLGQLVDDQNIAQAARVERGDHVRADETGSSRDDVHQVSSTFISCSISSGVAVAAPSLPTTMPAARLASASASSSAPRAA